MDEHLLDSQRVADLITTHIQDRQPFSFVRLGDGEGALLRFSEKSEMQDYEYLMAHFGALATIDDILEVQDALRHTIDSADLLGVRDDVWHAPENTEALDLTASDFFERFLATFPLREVERTRLDPHGARRIFFLWAWMHEEAVFDKKKVCSPWIGSDLHMREFWDDLLDSQKAIGLINSSKPLAKRLERRFSVDIEFIPVPGNEIDPGRHGPSRGRNEHHSALWRDIAHKIGDDLDGKVFFVGAGLLGKYYCHVIKKNGGIALDLGATLDAFDSNPTRDLVYMSKEKLTSSKYTLPPSFLLGWKSATTTRRSNKKVYFHLGVSKTGTTSLQTFLHANQISLEAQGAYYVRAGRNNGTAINHHELARAFGSGERSYDHPGHPPQKQAIDKLTNQIDKEINSSQHSAYIISSEFFSNFYLHREAEDLMLDFFSKYDCQFVFYVRNQFNWLVSCYAQAAKNGNMGLWLDEFLARPDSIPNSERFDGNFLRKIDYFSKYFSKNKVHVISFDKAVRNDNLIMSFLNVIGVQAIQSGTSSPYENNSPSANTLARKIVRRRLGIDANAEIEISVPTQSLVNRALLLGPYEWRRDELRALIRDRYKHINEELFNRYGVDIK